MPASRVTVESGDTYDADLLLVAVGRGPRTTDLGYEAQGIAMERGFVLTDERLRTNVEGVYAVGDIVPGLQLAHRGFQQGIFVAEQVAGLEPTPIDEAGIPRVTYCDPEVASVGLSEEAGADGVRRGRGRVVDLRPRRQRQEPDPQDQGFVKLVRRKDGPVVGIHLVGARVGELIGEAQLIYNWEAFPEDVAPARPHAPDPERSARRGPPGPGRQAAAQPRLTALPASGTLGRCRTALR